jgi:hypothetical protein
MVKQWQAAVVEPSFVPAQQHVITSSSNCHPHPANSSSMQPTGMRQQVHIMLVIHLSLSEKVLAAQCLLQHTWIACLVST